jgi:hypothetical protein
MSSFDMKSNEKKELKNLEVGGFDSLDQEVEFSYKEFKKSIKKQGYWGWVDDNKIIHYWIGKKIPIEDLIHFFGHEIGHQTGEQEKDDFKEEMRAESYGYTAALAYEFSKKILNTF